MGPAGVSVHAKTPNHSATTLATSEEPHIQGRSTFSLVCHLIEF